MKSMWYGQVLLVACGVLLMLMLYSHVSLFSVPSQVQNTSVATPGILLPQHVSAGRPFVYHDGSLTAVCVSNTSATSYPPLFRVP